MRPALAGPRRAPEVPHRRQRLRLRRASWLEPTLAKTRRAQPPVAIAPGTGRRRPCTTTSPDRVAGGLRQRLRRRPPPPPPPAARLGPLRTGIVCVANQRQADKPRDRAESGLSAA